MIAWLTIGVLAVLALWVLTAIVRAALGLVLAIIRPIRAPDE